MRHVVFGTAGHIDHGKTSLVRALTGIDCDRLPEEKSRGITIDLGFAHLVDGDLRIHFVDVPGHERLVHTMIAGAAGIDLALLVVAADEGVMPQTREHLEVIRLMGVPGGAVAVTKADLVDEELIEIVLEEIRELMAETPFAGVPVVPVSATTGAGVDGLRRVLVEQAAGVRPRQIGGRPFREPVDRVFTLAGAGTVVTGTSLWGELTLGSEVVLLPDGRSSRVRRLHVHGEERERVEAGERVAINLAGLSTAQVRRGEQVLTPGPWRPTNLVTLRLELLPNAPHPLDEGDELELHALAMRTPARLERLARRPLIPGATGEAQLSVREPVLVFPGDRVILRRPSPVNTLAGGVVLDAHRPRVRRSASGSLASLPGVAREEWPELLRSWIERAGLRAAAVDDLAGRMGTTTDAIEAPLGRLLEDRTVRVLSAQPLRLVAAQQLEELARAAGPALARRLEGQEVSSGVPARDFAALLLPRAALPLADLYLEELRQRGVLELSGGRVLPPGASAHMTELGEELARTIEQLYHDAGLDPPSPGEAAARLGAKPVTVEGICRFLVQRGRLVRLDGKLLIHRAALDAVARGVREWGVDAFAVGEFKDRFGLTRKLAIPILEWLDSERVTLRVGTERKVMPARRPG